MCEVRRSCRCGGGGAKTREAAVVALDTYRRRHPQGPPVDPLTAASRQSLAEVIELSPPWWQHDMAFEGSFTEAHSLQAVADSLVEEQRAAPGDPEVLAWVRSSEGRVRDDFDATVPGLAVLQNTADHHQRQIMALTLQRPGTRRNQHLRHHTTELRKTQDRLTAAQEQATRDTIEQGLPPQDTIRPVSGGADLNPATHRRWCHVGMVTQARTREHTRSYRVALIDGRPGGPWVHIDLPADKVGRDGTPHKGQIITTLDILASNDPGTADKSLIRQTRAVLNTLAIDPPHTPPAEGAGRV